MKTDELLIVGLAGLAVWMIWKNRGASAAAAVSPSAPLADNFVDEIFSSSGTPYSNGWRYYENGTAIDPSGNYYYQGQMVYRAASGATGAW